MSSVSESLPATSQFHPFLPFTRPPNHPSPNSNSSKTSPSFLPYSYSSTSPSTSPSIINGRGSIPQVTLTATPSSISISSFSPSPHSSSFTQSPSPKLPPKMPPKTSPKKSTNTSSTSLATSKPWNSVSKSPNTTFWNFHAVEPGRKKQPKGEKEKEKEKGKEKEILPGLPILPPSMSNPMPNSMSNSSTTTTHVAGSTVNFPLIRPMLPSGASAFSALSPPSSPIPSPYSSPYSSTTTTPTAMNIIPQPSDLATLADVTALLSSNGTIQITSGSGITTSVLVSPVSSPLLAPLTLRSSSEAPSSSSASASSACASAGKTVKGKDKDKDDNKRQFACHYSGCGKSFFRSEHLNRHLLLHTGTKNHSCKVCGKSFSRYDNMVQHEKTHMPKVNRVEKKPPRRKTGTVRRQRITTWTVLEPGLILDLVKPKRLRSFHFNAHRNHSYQIHEVFPKPWERPVKEEHAQLSSQDDTETEDENEEMDENILKISSENNDDDDEVEEEEIAEQMQGVEHERRRSSIYDLLN